MKSLCNSALFWKTESGIRTRGRPVAPIESGASLLKVLSSNRRILSTREGGAVMDLGATDGSVVGAVCSRKVGLRVSVE